MEFEVVEGLAQRFFEGAGAVDDEPIVRTGLITTGTYRGVLAWYSLIHHDPRTIRRPLDEFARVLRPGGHLLVGFFLGDALEPFDHAVVTAWRWPADLLAQELEAAGFDLIETHTRAAASGMPRPHGSIVARLKGADQGPS